MTPEISTLDSYKSGSTFALQQAKFLSDYFSVNGQISEVGSNLCISTYSDDSDKLYQIQSMLMPFGIKSSVQFDNVVANKWNLKISDRSIINFDKYINSDKKMQLQDYVNNYQVQSQSDDYSAIVSIKKVGIRDVYDLSLKYSHNFIANGHVVHNCNLASICLPKFVENGEFNHQKLYDVTRVVTRNLNNIIDINFYPVEKARVSNLKHRPIGLGVQGLADTFFKLKYPFDSPQARELNKRIFETIYFGALTESCLMAKESGHYSTYPGSPLSQGKFQFDLWGISRDTLMWDWNSLQEDIEWYGVRNSLVTAEMPTASTSQIMGNTETIEAITSNIYTRKTIAGDYYVINKYLMSDLMDLGLWNSEMIDMIKYYEGSIQKIPNIPQNIKEIYRTVYEIDQQSIIDMSADRGPFIDQTQSLNLHIAEPDFAKLNSCHFYGWKKGLKTGMYYLRSKPASEANKFGIDIDTIRMIEARDGIESINKMPDTIVKKSCPYNPNRKNEANDEGCTMCGS
jgi:ribonucleotide reductase alpha subunit